MEVTLLMPSVGGSTFMRWRSCMATRYAPVRLFAASGGVPAVRTRLRPAAGYCTDRFE